MSEKRFDIKESYNQAIFETENFKVIPSLGSMIEGWLLIVPKAYFLNFGLITDENYIKELDVLKTAVCEIMQKEYGDHVVFEHGPALEKSKVGCGVDYAHIHIVPISLSLHRILKLAEINFDWIKVDNENNPATYAHSGTPYLFIEDVNKKNYITSSKEIPSQFFRKVIANAIGKSSVSNWKENLFLETIEATYNTLGKYSICDYNKLNEYA